MDDNVLDLPEVLERVQDDWDLLLELIAIFLEDCPPKIEALKHAVKDKDFNEIKDISHSLKGSSANLAAKKINALFIRIEQMGKSQDTSGFDETIKELETQLGELRLYLDQLKKEKRG